jgi:hypothetical protein
VVFPNNAAYFQSRQGRKLSQPAWSRDANTPVTQSPHPTCCCHKTCLALRPE